MGLLVAGALILASAIKDHWIRAFYLWCIVLSCLLYSITIARMGEEPFINMHMNNLDVIIKMSVGIIVYIAATRIKNIEGAINVLCSFALFQCIIYLFQKMGWDLVKGFCAITGGEMIPMEPAGTLGNPNFFASVLAITSPLFLRGRWAFGLIVVIPILWLQSTSGAVIAFLVSFGYLAIKTKIRAWYAIFPLAAIGLWVFWTYLDMFEFDSFRQRAWTTILMTWENWFLIGNSPGSYPIFAKVEHAHNEYLETAFETGIIGITCMVGFGFTLLRRALMAKGVEMLICASLICLAVYSFFHYPLHLAPSGFIALVLMGIYTNGRFQDVR